MYEYLCTYTDIIERYSIDECFLDYTNSASLFGDPVKVAYKIKDDIYRMFGFTVNVGVGNNKLLAKEYLCRVFNVISAIKICLVQYIYLSLHKT